MLRAGFLFGPDVDQSLEHSAACKAARRCLQQKKKKSDSVTSLRLCSTFASHGVGYFSAFDVQNGAACRLPGALSVLRIFLPAADQRRSAKALLEGVRGISRQFRKAN